MSRRAPVQERTQRGKLLLLAFTGLLLSVTLSYLLNREEAVRMRSDLFPIWHAAKAYLEHGRSVYSMQNGIEMLAEFNNTVHLHDGLLYYPATLLLIVLPLAALPFQAAHFVWTLCVQWMFFLGTWLMMSASGWPRKIEGRTLVLALGMLSIPMWQNVIWSQFNAIAALSLGASYWMLRKGRLGMAGALAVGLSFKPQATLAPLLFLALWALLERRRWRLLGGLAAASAGLWLFAEVLQPGWVGDFLALAQVYVASPRYVVASVLDALWNPHQAVAALLLVSVVALTLRWRSAQPGHGAFELLLVYSLSVGWLALPMLGMIHLVVAPCAVVLLCWAVQGDWPMQTRKVALGFLTLYFAGIVVFLLGLVHQYGFHINWAEAIYKGLFPGYLALAALWGLSRYRQRQALGSIKD